MLLRVRSGGRSLNFDWPAIFRIAVEVSRAPGNGMWRDRGEETGLLPRRGEACGPHGALIVVLKLAIKARQYRQIKCQASVVFESLTSLLMLTQNCVCPDLPR